MGADLFHGREVLDGCGAGFEDLRFGGFGVAWGVVLGGHFCCIWDWLVCTWCVLCRVGVLVV